MVEARGSSRREILVFEVGGRLYGLAAAEVRELLRAVTILPLPLAPAVVEGVINLRGTTVPVLDLRAWLRLPAKPLEPSDHLILIGPGPHPLALRIDRAVELATLEVDAVGGDLDRAADEEGLGEVARRSDAIVPLLDPRPLVRLASAAVPAPALPGVAPPAAGGGP